jgi:acetylcholinesterase
MSLLHQLRVNSIKKYQQISVKLKVLLSAIVNDENMTKIFNENFEEIAPICFFFEANVFKSTREIGKILKKFYLPFDIVDIRSLNSLNKMFSDGVIGNGVHRFVHYVSNFTNIFYYKVSYSGRFSIFKYPSEKPYGVHHADDIQYYFNAKYVGPMINKTDPENLMVERMTRIWSAFAATG